MSSLSPLRLFLKSIRSDLDPEAKLKTSFVKLEGLSRADSIPGLPYLLFWVFVGRTKLIGLSLGAFVESVVLNVMILNGLID
jgi:hypothetical protein